MDPPGLHSKVHKFVFAEALLNGTTSIAAESTFIYVSIGPNLVTMNCDFEGRTILRSGP